MDGQKKGRVVVYHDISEVNRLRRELDRLNQKLRKVQAKYTFQDIIGENKRLKEAIATARTAAQTPATIMLRGESGTGKEVIECKYQAALPFSEGYAAVCEEDLWGVIDTQGEYVIEPSYDEFHPFKIASLNTNIGSAAFNEGLAAVRKGAYWALIDTQGNIIRAAKGEDCPYKSISGRCIVFSDANEKCGLLDLEGNEILAPAFGNIGLFGK